MDGHVCIGRNQLEEEKKTLLVPYVGYLSAARLFTLSEMELSISANPRAPYINEETTKRPWRLQESVAFFVVLLLSKLD